jgi:hypothetical protein
LVYGTDYGWIKKEKENHLHLVWEDVKGHDQYSGPENQHLFLINQHDFKKANDSQCERLNISKALRFRYETAFVKNDRRCTTSKELFDQIAVNYNFNLTLLSETKWGELYDNQIKKLWERP